MDFITHGDLVFNFQHGVLQAEVALVDKAVSIHDVAQDAVGNLVGPLVVLQHHGIDAMILHRVSCHDDVGRHILGNAAARLYQHPAAYVAVLLDDDVAAQDGAIVHDAFAGYHASDAQHAVVVDLHVVAQVHSVHQVVVATNAGGVAFMCCAGHYHIFVDSVVVTDDELAVFTRVMEVLGGTAQHGTMVHFVPFTHAGAVQDACSRHDDAVVSNFHIAFDLRERLDCNILANLCSRIYVR